MRRLPQRLLPWLPILILLPVALVYGPSLKGGFLLDDWDLVAEHPFVRSPQPLADYFAQEDGVLDAGHTGYYRPLVLLTYRLEYRLFGMSPAGFRVGNLFYHLLACLVLYRVLRGFTDDRPSALWATLLFALHPVHTEAVSWITARNNVLVTLFSLLTFLGHRRYVRSGSSAAAAGASAAYAAALLCKEFALMVPAILFAYHRCSGEAAACRRREAAAYLFYALTIAGYFLLRRWATGMWLGAGGSGELSSRLLHLPYVWAWDLRLLLWPAGLHSFIVEYPDAWFHPMMVGGWIAAAAALWGMWKYRSRPLFCFTVPAFVLALLPVSHLFSTSSVTLVSMRWLYFPAVFLTPALAVGIREALRRRRTAAALLLGVLCLGLGAVSLQLNRQQWRDEDHFYRREVYTFNNIHYAGGLAGRLSKEKNYAAAEILFRLATRLYPDRFRYSIGYAALLLETGRPGEAVEMLEAVRSRKMHRPERVQWLNNLAVGLASTGKPEEALPLLLRAAQMAPQDPETWTNLAGVYTALGDEEAAARARERLETQRKAR